MAAQIAKIHFNLFTSWAGTAWALLPSPLFTTHPPMYENNRCIPQLKCQPRRSNLTTRLPCSLSLLKTPKFAFGTPAQAQASLCWTGGRWSRGAFVGTRTQL